VIASVHVADLRVVAALSAVRRTRLQRTVSGLRHANLAFAAPLSPSVVPRPSLHRVVMVASWDGDAALDRFLAIDHFAEVFQNGWHVRLQPLRASGSWPGLDLAIPRAREVPHEGPVAVLTLGRLRARRAVDFFRTSARAEAQILESPGLIWATGMGLPPFVGTFSLWRESASLMSYAYGKTNSPHGAAIARNNQNLFHHLSAFARFRPYAWVGELHGKNPLAASWLQSIESDSRRAPSEARASADNIVPIGDQHGGEQPRTRHRPRSSRYSN
jgi:hypothetical protein